MRSTAFILSLLVIAPSLALASSVAPVPRVTPALPTIPGLSADYLDGQDGSAFAAAGHDHDDRYYTESESDARFAAAGHQHDERYYTKAEVEALLAGTAPGDVAFVDEFFGRALDGTVWAEAGPGRTSLPAQYRGEAWLGASGAPGAWRRIEAPMPNGINLWGQRGERLRVLESDAAGSFGMDVTLELGFMTEGVLVAGFRYEAGSEPSTWTLVTRLHGDATGTLQTTATTLGPGSGRTWEITFAPPSGCCGVDVLFWVNGAHVGTHTLETFAPHGIGFFASTLDGSEKLLTLDRVEWSIAR